MSMVRELINAIALSEKELENQIAEQSRFLQELRVAHAEISATVGSSVLAYDVKMLAQLGATRDQVEKTIGQLQKSVSDLKRVRNI